jgi:hypothetical protein
MKLKQQLLTRVLGGEKPLRQIGQLVFGVHTKDRKASCLSGVFSVRPTPSPVSAEIMKISSNKPLPAMSSAIGRSFSR